MSRHAARTVKNTLRPASGLIVEVAPGSVPPSRSIGLRIAKEIEPGAVGLFLMGAVMTLQTGGEVKFQPRLIEVQFDGVAQHPESLILDGKQRLASLYQALTRPRAKVTRDEKMTLRSSG